MICEVILEKELSEKNKVLYILSDSYGDAFRVLDGMIELDDLKIESMNFIRDEFLIISNKFMINEDLTS
ncbi:MAG: hypothetical protein O6940_05875 [Ignavibacteria bacterium]|nr:hypothetical protein [Ignavibacteria bacterium]